MSIPFELRIYVLPSESIDEVVEENKIHDITDLADETFINTVEEIGTVYSLSSFLNLDCIAPDTDYIRAFFVPVSNPEVEPVRADMYYTCIYADKITKHAPSENCGEKVLFTEEEDTEETKTYTIVVRNYDTELDTDEITDIIGELEGIECIEVVCEDYPYIRLRVETVKSFDYNVLEDTLDNNCLKCEFISVE